MGVCDACCEADRFSCWSGRRTATEIRPVNTHNTHTSAAPRNLPSCAFPPPIKGVHSIPDRGSAANGIQFRSKHNGHHVASSATATSHLVVTGTGPLPFALSNTSHSDLEFRRILKKILQIPVPAHAGAMIKITKD